MDNKDYENHTVNPIQDRPDLADKIENKVETTPEEIKEVTELKEKVMSKVN